LTWCASSPHHVTSIFIPRRAGTLEESGSVGAGIAVEPRLTACIGARGWGWTPAGTYSTANRVARLLGRPGEEARIGVRAPLPPGAGYAVSAAAALATGLVLARAGGEGWREALLAAHAAEILESTGLGDVLALSCGVGIVLRLRPGAPGRGEVDCIQLPGTLEVLGVETGREHTSRFLSLVDDEFAAKARRALDRIFEARSVEAFIEWSMWFSRESGMLSLALGGSHIPRLPGLIGYYAKKRVVVFFVEREWSGDAASILRRAGWTPRLLTPSSHGPSIWWEPRWVA